MALVDYPSSDEDEIEDEDTSESSKAKASKNTTNTNTQNLKRKRDAPSSLPPLPSAFRDLYATPTRTSVNDDPTLHQGRKRVIPHIEGNWPTHIYIDWYPSPTEDASLTSLISFLQKALPLDADTTSKIHSSLTSDINVPLPLHISLSRSLGVSTAQKDSFIESLSLALKTSGIRPFDISFTGLKLVANFENTRWFLVLTIPKPESNGLNKILHVCNSVVKTYGQPPLYPASPTEPSPSPSLTPAKKQQTLMSQEPRRNAKGKSQSIMGREEMQDATDTFHISLAWMLQDPSEELLKLIEEDAKEYMEKLREIEVRVEHVKCKVGNVVTSIPLKANHFESG